MTALTTTFCALALISAPSYLRVCFLDLVKTALGKIALQQDYRMRGTLRTLIAVAAVTAFAGCSDSSSTSPSARSVLAPGHGPTLDISPSLTFSGYRTASFTLTASGGKYTVGDGDGLFTLTFPANSVCDPAVSSYGPGTWDSPCTTLSSTQSITVSATYGFTTNGFAVDFQPALRFNPNTSVKISSPIYAGVLIPNAAYFAANPSILRYVGIYYAPTLGGVGETDFAFDASVMTHVNLGTGQVWRRIKHFSGYNIGSGLPCTPSPDDPDCIEVEDGPVIEQ